MDFIGKVVWITGASAGIGEDLAKTFSKQGSKLVLSARNETELKRVKADCAGSESDISVLPFDLANLDLTRVKEITKQGLACFGKIDILINNGGISQRSLVKDTDISVDMKIMDINYFGQIALTKAVLPHMLERKSGHLVVVSSVMGKMSTPLRSAYCASKHALHGFFDALRSEIYLDNIKILLVCPASIKTDISLNALTGNGNEFGKMDEQQANGLSVEICSKQILQAIHKNKEEILVGPPIKNVVFLKRFFPGLYSSVIKKAKVT